MSSNHPELTVALKSLVDARPRYDEAQAFYDGTIDEVFASRKLKELFGTQGQYYRINYARTPVDVLLERTTVQGWTCPDAGQLAAVELAWEDNDLGLEAKDIHRRAYEYGDAYLIGWPDDELASGVSLYAHDPQGVRVFYDPRRPRVKSHAVHTWLELGDDENGFGAGTWYRVNLYYPDRIEQWVSRDAAITAVGQVNGRTASDSEYRLLGDDGEIDNPTPGIIPVFHFRTGRPYGRPEHADAYGPQYAINKLLLSLMGAVDHAVLPQRYVATEAALDQNRADDAFDQAVGVDGAIDTEVGSSGLDPRSSMESGPGNIWLLSGKNIKAGQFAPADPDAFIKPMESLVNQMADVTDLPADRYRRSGQATSGESKRMDDIPINKKADDRHAQFGVTWHEVAGYVCTVKGLGDTDAQVAWDPPETYSDKTSWETALLQLQAGIPFDQIMRERGYSSDSIAEWQADDPVLAPPIVVPQPVPSG